MRVKNGIFASKSSSISSTLKELLLRIFYGTVFDTYNSTQALITLGSVSSKWRGIIHRESLLWTWIHLTKCLHTQRTLHDDPAILHLYYQSIHEQSLSIIIHKGWNPPPSSLMTVTCLGLEQYGTQLKSFRKCGPNSRISSQILQYSPSSNARYPVPEELSLVIDDAYHEGLRKPGTGILFREVPMLRWLEVLSVQPRICIGLLPCPWAQPSTLVIQGTLSPAVLVLLPSCMNLEELVINVEWMSRHGEDHFCSDLAVTTLANVRKFTWGLGRF